MKWFGRDRTESLRQRFPRIKEAEVNTHLRLLGQGLLEKFGISHVVSREEMDTCVKATLVSISEKYNIQEYDRKQGWHEILAAREFLLLLGTCLLSDEMREVLKKYKDTDVKNDIHKQTHDELDPLTKEEGEKRKKNKTGKEKEEESFLKGPDVDFAAILKLPADFDTKIESGYEPDYSAIAKEDGRKPWHKWFDPSSIDIITVYKEPDEIRLLRLAAFIAGMLYQEDGIRNSKVDIREIADMTAKNREQERRKEGKGGGFPPL